MDSNHRKGSSIDHQSSRWDLARKAFMRFCAKNSTDALSLQFIVCNFNNDLKGFFCAKKVV